MLETVILCFYFKKKYYLCRLKRSPLKVKEDSKFNYGKAI